MDEPIMKDKSIETHTKMDFNGNWARSCERAVGEYRKRTAKRNETQFWLP